MRQDPSNYFLTELQPALQSRAIVPPLPGSIRPWQAIFLRTGSSVVDDVESDDWASRQTIYAPAMICWHAGAGLSLSLSAGSTGVHLALGELFLVSVLGKRPEAHEMRDAILNFIVLPLDANPETVQRVQIILDEIAHEQERPSAGQLLVIEAQLRCLLVHLWRHAQQTDEAAQSAGQRTIILRRFRHLVEANFHGRWRVRDYANALNMTTDRLHDAATRILGKTPLELIHDRTHREAQSMLARSNLTLDQIAEHLSFKSTQQFSAFFRKLEGVPPAKYRRLMAASSDDRAISESLDFSDWP